MGNWMVVPFRMSPEEKVKLKEMCKAQDMSMAQWVRKAINTAYKKHPKK